MRTLSLTALVATLLAGPTANAATITVDSESDDSTDTTSCTLRDAVTAAETDAIVDGCSAGEGDDTIVVPATRS